MAKVMFLAKTIEAVQLLREPQCDLSRDARTLLVLIDGNRHLKELKMLASFNGVQAFDEALAALHAHNLIQELPEAAEDEIPIESPDAKLAEANLLSLDFALPQAAFEPPPKRASLAQTPAPAPKPAPAVSKPAAVAIAASAKLDTPELRARLEQEIRTRLIAELTPKVTDELRAQLLPELRAQITKQLYEKLVNALRPLVEVRLRQQLEPRIRESIEREYRQSAGASMAVPECETQTPSQTALEPAPATITPGALPPEDKLEPSMAAA